MFYLWHSASGLHWGHVACRVTNKIPHLFKKSFGHWIRPRLVQLLLGDTTDWKNFHMRFSINPIVLAFPANNLVTSDRKHFPWAGCGLYVSHHCNSLSSVFLFHILASVTLLHWLVSAFHLAHTFSCWMELEKVQTSLECLILQIKSVLAGLILPFIFG